MGFIKNLFFKQNEADFENKKRDLVHGVIAMSTHPQFQNFFQVTFVDMEDREWNVFATIDKGMRGPIKEIVRMQKEKNDWNNKKVQNVK